MKDLKVKRLCGFLVSATQKAFGFSQKSILPTRLALAASVCALTMSAIAQTTIVETRTGGQNISWSTVINGAPSATWGDSTAKSTASGVTGGIGSKYATPQGTPDQATSKLKWSITPTLPTAGGVYTVEITHTSSTASSSLTHNVTVTGGSGLPATTTVFSAAVANAWENVGTLTLDPGVTQPTIVFEFASGTLSSSARWYADAIKFIDVTPEPAKTWSGGGANDNWTTGLNWVGGVAPINGQGVKFSGTTRLTPLLNATYTLDKIEFDAAAGAFVIGRSGGESVTISGGSGIRNASTNLQTLNFPVTLSSVGNIIDAASGGIAINEVVSGSVGLTKTGTNVLTLGGSSANTYSGSTVINGGAVALAKSSGNAIPNGPVSVNSGGTLRNQANNQIDDASIITIVNGATNDLNGFTETVETIQSTSANTAATIALGTNGILTVKPATGVTYNLASGISGYYGRITGAAGSKLIMTGTGEYRLHNSTNTFQKLEVRSGLVRGGNLSGNNFETIFGAAPTTHLADAILLDGGTIGASFTMTLHTNRGVTLGAGGGTINASAGAINIPSKITGVGSLTKNGGITVTLSGPNDYTGATIVNAGKVITTTASTGAGTYSVADSAALEVRVAAAGQILSASGLTVGNSTLDFDLNAAGFSSSAVMSVIGTVDVNGSATVNVKGFNTTGTITLLEYAGRNGAGSFNLGTVPPNVTASLNDDTVNKRVILQVTAVDSLRWNGDLSGTWDLNNAGNTTWQYISAGTPTFYQQTSLQGDTVRFDDQAIGTTSVDISAAVSPYAVTVDAAANYTFSGVGKISGTARLTKSGSGRLTILSTNDFTHGTTLNNGSVVIGNNSPLGTGLLTINGISIETDSATGRTLSIPVNLNGNLNASGPGAITFQTGLFTITGGSREINVDTINLAINNIIGQDTTGRSLTKNGSGTLSLAAANTFSGGVVHNEGTLRVNSNNGLGISSTPVTLANGVTLATTAGTGRTLTHNFTLNGDLTLGQAVGGTASLTMAGSLNLAGGIRTITIANASDVISGIITNGGLIKSGAGNLDLTANNTFESGLRHSQGTLRVNNNTSLGQPGSPVIFSDGVNLATTTTSARTLTNNFTLEGDLAIGQTNGGTAALTLAGSMNLSGGVRTITISNVTDTISAVITNGGLAKSGTGTLVLSGANTYAGGTTVNEGTLQVSTTSLPGDLVNNSIAIFSQTTAGIYAGSISGSGTVSKLGSGAVTFSGNNNYSGNTTVTAGSLLIDGTLSSANVAVTNATLGGSGTISAPVNFSNGFLAAGGTNIGTLTLANGVTLSGTTNNWQLGAFKDDSNGTPGLDFDQVSITGGNLFAGGAAVVSISFTDPSLAPDFAQPFWQFPRKWTVIKMNGGSNGGGTGFQTIVTSGTIYAGTFSTAIEPDGSLSLSFTPAGPTAPILLNNLSDKSVIQGQNTSFTISATGTAPLTYRWFFQNAEDFSQTSNTFTRIGATIGDAGQYYVIVGNSHGSQTSSVATLTVLVPPSIQTQPASQTVEPGGNATFSVAALGTAPFSYQWKFDGGNIAGATNSVYSITGVTTNHAGAYSVMVTNVAGSILSTNAILTVGNTGPSITALAITNNIATLVWTSVADNTYRAQFTTNLTQTNWTSIVPDVTASGSSASVTNSTAGSSQQFYRVLLLP